MVALSSHEITRHPRPPWLDSLEHIIRQGPEAVREIARKHFPSVAPLLPPPAPEPPKKTCGGKCQDCRIARGEIKWIDPRTAPGFRTDPSAGSFASKFRRLQYAPTWRDITGVDPKTLAFTYREHGPVTQRAYEGQLLRHRMSCKAVGPKAFPGAGPWDFARDPYHDDEPAIGTENVVGKWGGGTAMTARYPDLPRNKRRWRAKNTKPLDAELLRRYMTATGGKRATDPQRGAYEAVIERGVPRKAAARQLKTDPGSLRKDLRLLEKKARRWSRGRGGTGLL